MTTAQLVNLILSKLRTGRVEFIEISSSGACGWIHVDFSYGGNYYLADYSVGELIVFRRNEERTSRSRDLYSNWVEGVLNGKTRDAEGVLS